MSINASAADNDLDHLTPAEISVMRSLRERGWAICMFTPWEIAKADPSRVEDAMAEAGWRQIDWSNE